MSDDKNSCQYFLAGHATKTAAQDFLALSRWCEKNNIEHDVYGSGDTLQAFEQEIAQLLGFEAGLFVITGTMAQAVVLDAVCEQVSNPVVAMHSSCHINKHEAQNFQFLRRFTALPTGNAYQPWLTSDLASHADNITAAVYELPMREIGGQLPQWEQLQDIKDHCQQHDIHLHMDGARLWEAAAYYGKTHAEIADGFQSVYVSFYKGIGAFAGAMLLGKQTLIDKARIRVKREGGNVFKRSPYAFSAMMQFEQRLEQMPTLFDRTQQLYLLLQKYSPSLQLNPSAPQSNMLHVHLSMNVDEAEKMRSKLAHELGIWLCNGFQVGTLPNSCYFEWYVGDNALNLSDEIIIQALEFVHKFNQK